MSALPRIVSSLVEENEEQDPSSKDAAHHEVHWIVSWDINETILVGDEVGGDTREDCLNKILAKSAFVRMPKQSEEDVRYDYENTSSLTPTHWWDGTLLGDKSAVPPLYTGWEWPGGCCPYYRTSLKRLSKSFTEHHGAIYKPLQNEMTRKLGPVLDDNSSPFRNILPAFWSTISRLVEEQESNGRPPITFVFRTFGTDLPQIAQAMTAFCRGKHPDYPGFVHPEYELDASRLYQARWEEQHDKYFSYQLYSHDDNERLVASGDQEVLDLLHDTSKGRYSHGIRDDYHMWKSHGWEPWAGKPVWKTDDSNHHHVLLDDNIHNLTGDGIASVRTPRSTEEGAVVFESTQAAEAWHGMHLVRVPTIEPILNEDWFLEQIHKVQAAAIQERARHGKKA